MLCRKNTTPLHSEEELRLAAEYLYAKKVVSDNYETIKAFKEWLENELAQTKKLWANFHRVFYANYLLLCEKVPELNWESGSDEPFEYKEGFRTYCPFDMDSHYFVYYKDEVTVDVTKLPKKWIPPYGTSFYPDEGRRELTENEYCAYIIFDICKRELEKCKELLLLAENPKDLAYRRIGICNETGEDAKAWIFALYFETSPFEVEKRNVKISRYCKDIHF